ncbi:MAG: ubiquitin-like protein Pup [Actinobacteria bacterium]|nr:ubiquitin-like protein Pup [Actinomycetota bacterium]NBY14756.1 ubiquitin-like protein Pup [Actinomycetota bacterium]
MSEQSRGQISASDKGEADVANEIKPTVELLNVDSLLAKIDAVLEQNSEEFVNSFVQKGGQ